MKRIALIALLGLFSMTLMSQNIDVLHYSIQLDEVNFSNHKITAQTEVTLKALSDLTTLNLELKNLTVSAVVSTTDSILGFSQSGNTLSIQLFQNLMQGDTAVLSIAYSGVPFSEAWGGFHFNGQYAFNLGVGFDSNPHNLGKTWFPCVDNFTDKATYDVFVNLPEGKMAVCGGLLIDTILNADSTRTWHWSVSQEIPTYLISVSIGNYILHQDVYQGLEKEIPITVYARPAESSKVDAAFAHLKPIAASLEESFGAYPFNRLGYVGTQLGCMEHVDNIAISHSLISETTNENTDYYIAHELAHAWFGNKVTCATAGDMWLNEGFATFCGYFATIDIYGEEAYRETMRNLTLNITKKCHLDEGWISLNNLSHDLVYGTTAYDKGALVVHTLMNYLGRETFCNAMKYYLNEYAYSTASSQNLCDAISTYTGIDMTDFFNAWVYTPGSPHYSIDSVTSTLLGDQYEAKVFMRQKHRGDAFIGNNVRYEVAFVDQNWNIHTDTVCFDGEQGCSVKHLNFNPILVLADYYDKTADARTDYTDVIRSTGERNYAKVNFTLYADELSDSLLFRLEHHWVAPDSLPEPIPGMHLSTSRYYSIHTASTSNVALRGCFKYEMSDVFDAGLSLTENDTILLMYRPNAGAAWQIASDGWSQGLAYFGYHYVNQLLDGDYTFAALDKNYLLLEENKHTSPRVVVTPNPAALQTTLWLDRITSGQLVLINEAGQTVRVMEFKNTDNLIISLAALPKGFYFVQGFDAENRKSFGTKLLVE